MHQASDELRIVQARVAPGDPHINTDGRDRLSLRYSIYDTLVRRDYSGRFVASLATGWICEPDARTWTLSLRDDVSFSDGRRLGAEDVIASIERVSDPAAPGEMATQGVLSSYLDGATYEAIDRSTLRIVTTHPLADLLDLLVDIAIIPARSAHADDAGPDTPGTGPYRLTNIGDEWARMEAVPGHWAGMPRFHAVRWDAEPSAMERARIVARGTADLATDIGPGGQSLVEMAPGATAYGADTSLCVALLLNASAGVCVDRRVRQALNYGANVDRIVEQVMGGAAVRVNGPLSQLHLGHDPSMPAYPHDPARALRLLREAGHGDGMTLTIDVPTSLPDEAQALVDALAVDYAAIRVTVRTRVHEDRPAYAEMVRAKQIADACCFDSSPLSTYRVLREKLHSGVAGPWWQGYANPEVDQLIDEAAATVDDRSRQRVYRAAYRIIRDDAPWLLLYAPRVIFGRGQRLRGWQPAINGLVRIG
jgi:peptide/nickel transport system substrate-binding protein